MVADWDNRPEVTPEDISEYARLGEQFCQHPGTTRTSILDGVQFHRAQPVVRKPSPLVDHTAYRLDVAKRVQDAIRRDCPSLPIQSQREVGMEDPKNFQLNMMQLSLFMCVEMDIIHHMETLLLEDMAGWVFAEGVSAVEAFLAICK